jgi:hypothetical protein
MEMKSKRFGIEIEFTGITRQQAAEVTAAYFGTDAGMNDTVRDGQGRRWTFVADGSINKQRKLNGRIVPAESAYSVEMVSPICVWEDIPVIQEIIRRLRAAGGFSNPSCGIHVHVDGSPFNAGSLRNLTNIMYCKEDLIYKALGVEVERERRYCKKTEQRFLDELNRRRPRSLEDVSRIWYNGSSGAYARYDNSRYRCLNLHSLFEKGTIEFRLFNSDIHHAGKIKAYIQFCLAVTNQALNQCGARTQKTQSSNEKYTFRTWLLRLGMVGDEFKTARTHLLERLDGCIAWKDPEQALRQRERLQQAREGKSRFRQPDRAALPQPENVMDARPCGQTPPPDEPEDETTLESEDETAFTFTMSM